MEVLKCQKCGCNNTRVVKVLCADGDDSYGIVQTTSIMSNNDEYKSNVVVDHVKRKSFGYRPRNLGEIHLFFECEDGCNFSIKYFFHKGEVYTNAIQ